MNPAAPDTQLPVEAIVNLLPDSLLILDSTFHVVSANRSFYRTFKVCPRETIGRPIQDLGNGQWNIPQLRRLLETVISERSMFEGFEMRHHFEHTGAKAMRLSAHLVEQEGKPDLVMLVIEDVTRVIDVRERLERSEARERSFVDAILDTSGALIAVADSRACIVRFNRACEELTGYTADEVQGRSVLELFILEHERPAVEQVVARLLAGETMVEHENYWRTKSGEQRFIRWRNSALTDEHGEINFVIATGIDITDRLRAETSLRESREDLNRAQQVAHVGSWRMDVRRNELSWSDEVYRMFGVPAGTSLTYEAFLSHVHPDDRAYVNREWQAALRGKPYDIEHRIVVDGHVRWVREQAELELDDSGTLRGGFGTVQDITVRKRLDEDLQRRASELAASNAELESFSVSVSHDLRNPLNNIVAMAHVLKTRSMDVLDARGRTCIEQIEKNTARMAETITDLLQLSRLPRQEITVADVNLSALARDVVQEIREAEPARTVEVVIHDRMHASADRRLAKIALENLMRNAWKYTSRQAEPRIEIGMRQHGHRTVFYVRDNGVGFAMKDARRIFSPFYRAHSDKEFKGTGIGLSIVQRIMQKHGGDVWAEAEPGKGASFYFSFPQYS